MKHRLAEHDDNTSASWLYVAASTQRHSQVLWERDHQPCDRRDLLASKVRLHNASGIIDVLFIGATAASATTAWSGAMIMQRVHIQLQPH
jgi:hypothetical protein